MKTHLKLKLLAVALVFPLLVSQAFAQNATGTLLQTGTGLANFSIAQNAPFSLDLNITDHVQLDRYHVFLPVERRLKSIFLCYRAGHDGKSIC